EQIAVLPRLRIDARARRVDEPDHRDAVAQRHLAQARDLDLAGLADRSALDREVVGGGAHHASFDAAVAADDRVGGRLVGAEVRHLRAVDADLEPLAVVEEAIEPLARAPLAALVLLADLGLAAHLLDARAPLLQILDAILHVHRVIPRMCFVSSTVAGVRPAARAIDTACATSSPFDFTISPDGR